MSPSRQQLRAARAWLNLSRAQAAHAAGLCPETLGKAERGDPSISLTTLEALVSAYGTRGIVFRDTSGIERRAA